MMRGLWLMLKQCIMCMHSGCVNNVVTNHVQSAGGTIIIKGVAASNL